MHSTLLAFIQLWTACPPRLESSAYIRAFKEMFSTSFMHQSRACYSVSWAYEKKSHIICPINVNPCWVKASSILHPRSFPPHHKHNGFSTHPLLHRPRDSYDAWVKTTSVMILLLCGEEKTLHNKNNAQWSPGTAADSGRRILATF